MDETPLQFKVIQTYKNARASTMTLPHGKVNLPIYMPVGTKGTIKGLTSREMHEVDCHLLLANTYHMNNSPGAEFLGLFGGIHKFMNWDRNVLTDSGGFQMVSLSKLCEVNEEGVLFEHPETKEKMFLKPEDSIKAQIQIGSDIMMALDHVVCTTTQGPEVEESCQRTIRWIYRNIDAHSNQKHQNLFPIIQGALDLDLRQRCLDEMLKVNANGYAIGGLSGGEKKEDFIRVVHFCCQKLPPNKPRYLMGVGFPEDLVVCVCLGVDMFDCVYPSRTARFGTAFSDSGLLKLKLAKYKLDFSKIDENCDCEACANYTRSFFNSITGKEEVAASLLTKHNIRYLLLLMKRVREAIIE